MIILDFGSGETCKNDIPYIKRMIDELKAADTGKHRVVIKWQLFAPDTLPEKVPVPLSLLAFDEAYNYARELGYETTASVFDTWSLSKLLKYDVPFVKLACRPGVYPLLGVPWMVNGENRRPPRAVVSVADGATGAMLKQQWDVDVLCCVPDYPAYRNDYEDVFSVHSLECGISDHTDEWYLYREWNPTIYECHYKLEDSTGPDAASYARTPGQLREVL